MRYRRWDTAASSNYQLDSCKIIYRRWNTADEIPQIYHRQKSSTETVDTIVIAIFNNIKGDNHTRYTTIMTFVLLYQNPQQRHCGHLWQHRSNRWYRWCYTPDVEAISVGATSIDCTPRDYSSTQLFPRNYYSWGSPISPFSLKVSIRQWFPWCSIQHQMQV